jgi:glycogen operon protein
MRSYWKGDDGFLPAFSRRVLGSADLFEHQGRKPWASVNFVTAHDGFTLADLWAYNEKHNEANGEANRDGHDDNRSWNCGVEGETDDPAVLDLRDRMRRSIMATMLLSQGTPMLLMGDEIGRTQHGNNNAYCQDNEIAWVDWSGIKARDRAFMEFTRAIVRMRKRYKLLRCNRFLHGEPVDEEGTPSVVWFRPDGSEMESASWTDARAKVVGLLLSDAATRLLILVNAYHETIPFTLPDSGLASAWQVRIDAGSGAIDPPDRRYAPGHTIELERRSLLLLAGEIG